MRRLVCQFLTVFTLAGCASGVDAGTIVGIVEDARTGAPLEGASVGVRPGLGDESDTQGRFEIRQVPPGVYVVRASHVGFWDGVQREVGVSETGRVEVRLVLMPRVIALGEMEVAAEPVGAAEIHRMPVFVTVLKRGEAFEGQATSVREVLSTSIGVQVVRLGGLGSFGAISIRGSSAEQVEVYLDGILLNSALGGGVNLSNLSLAHVSHIEVYRGAAVGDGGMGGTVHIRTRTPGKGWKQGGSGSWGSFDTRSLNAMVSEKRRKTTYLVVADYTSSDNDFRFLDDNGTEYNLADDVLTSRRNSDFFSSDLLGKWSYRFNGHRRLYVQENLYWKRQGIPGISNNQSKHARMNTFRSLTKLGVLIPDWLDRFSVRQTLFFSHRREGFVDRFGEVGVGRQDNRYRTRSYGWRGKVRTVFGKQHAAALGVSVRREAFLPEERLNRADRLFESSRWTASGQVGTDWALPKRRGVFSASARVEYQDSRVFEENPYRFSPLAPDSTTGQTLVSVRAGGRFDLRPGFWLKANVGRSHRAPSFYEFFGDRGGVIGNTGLKPERGLTWDVGFHAQLEGRGAVLEAAYFDHRYTDLIQVVQFSQGMGRARNIGKARVRGMEAMLRGRPFGRWMLSGNYTYQRAVDASRVPHRRGRVLPNRPQHEAHAHTGLTLGRWRGFYDYIFQDGNFLDRANLRPVRARHIHHVGMRYMLYRHVEVTLEAKNLLDNQVADLWGYPLPGRSFFVTVRESF